MPAGRHLGAIALLLSGAWLSPAPVLASSIGIDFGRSAGDDTLDGGGSGWTTAPPAREGARGRGWSGPAHSGAPAEPPRDRAARQSPRGSVSYVRPRSTYIRGTGVFANANPTGGSVVYVHSAPPAAPLHPPGPRIVSVEDERLDRRPYGPNGISVQHVGSMKIIRIAPNGAQAASSGPGKDMAALPAPFPEARRAPARAERAAPAEESRPTAPADPVSEGPPAQESLPPVDGAAASFLEPWTDEWLSDCVSRHATFDASLGTYLAEDGLRRFCTGETG